MQVTSFRSYVKLVCLAVLQVGPAHGYFIVEKVRECSGGVFDMMEVIYQTLHTMEKEGYVVSQIMPAVHTTQKRRVYRLTELGETFLWQSVREWQQYATAMNATLRACGCLES